MKHKMKDSISYHTFTQNHVKM